MKRSAMAISIAGIIGVTQVVAEVNVGEGPMYLRLSGGEQGDRIQYGKGKLAWSEKDNYYVTDYKAMRVSISEARRAAQEAAEAKEAEEEARRKEEARRALQAHYRGEQANTSLSEQERIELERIKQRVNTNHEIAKARAEAEARVASQNDMAEKERFEEEEKLANSISTEALMSRRDSRKREEAVIQSIEPPVGDASMSVLPPVGLKTVEPVRAEVNDVQGSPSGNANGSAPAEAKTYRVCGMLVKGKPNGTPRIVTLPNGETVEEYGNCTGSARIEKQDDAKPQEAEPERIVIHGQQHENTVTEYVDAPPEAITTFHVIPTQTVVRTKPVKPPVPVAKSKLDKSKPAVEVATSVNTLQHRSKSDLPVTVISSSTPPETVAPLVSKVLNTHTQVMAQAPIRVSAAEAVNTRDPVVQTDSVSEGKITEVEKKDVSGRLPIYEGGLQLARPVVHSEESRAFTEGAEAINPQYVAQQLGLGPIPLTPDNEY